MIRLVVPVWSARTCRCRRLPSARPRTPRSADRRQAARALRRDRPVAHGVPPACASREVLPRTCRRGGPLAHRASPGISDDPLDRWHRPGAVRHHSRHQHRRRAVGSPATLVWYHRSHHPASGPTAQEDVLVFALITVLCEWSGATALEAGPIDADERWRRDGRWTEDLAGDVRRGWRIRHAPGRRRWPEEPAISDGGDPGVRLRDAVAADPAARWTVDRLAAAAGIGLRSLQRRLAAAGTTPNRLVAETRLAAAAEFLVAGDAGLAEIGFACGFADQPRFTRTFRRYAGLTPAAYRTAFAAGGEQAPLTDPDRRTARRARPRPRRGVTGR